jgi:CheY-like chemotaxis protein
MQRVILVVSPDAEFLQQIRSHLEEGGRFQVIAASSAHEALNLANSDFFEVAILDGDIDDIPFVAFSRDLAALQSDLKILVFPPDNNPHSPLLDGLVVNGFLTKPFSGPEIGQALTNLFSDRPSAHEVHGKQIDDLMKQWLQNPKTGSQKAEQILKTTTAQTVLIIIKGHTTASTGSTTEKLISNVNEFLSRYWKDDENSELARFLKVDGENSERFLYATKLVSNVVLVLIYPYTATIQQVRRELNQVKDNFQKNYPTTAELRQEIAKQALADISARNKVLEAMQPLPVAISQTELDELHLLQGDLAKEHAASPLSEEELSNLNNIILDMPSPDPEPGSPNSSTIQPDVADRLPDWLNELPPAESPDQAQQEKNKEVIPQTENGPFISASLDEINKLTGVTQSELPPMDAEVLGTSEISTQFVNEPLPEIEFKLPWEVEESAEETTTEVASMPAKELQPIENKAVEIDTNILDAAPTGESSLPPPLKSKEREDARVEKPAVQLPPELKDFRFNYTCILIPGSHDQFLARDLSERLSVIMPQFHLAQGWRLTNITIRPQYMLWTVSVAMGVCPQQIIHDIRGLTSAHIFANFPEIAKSKTSDDFWSSYYLAISGSEPPPVNLIFDFVSQAWTNKETTTP